MLKLISATPSPFARRVRIALIEKSLPFELLTENPWEQSTQTPQFNPLEKLPVLILKDGSSVYESNHILDYLDTKFPHPSLLPADLDDILAVREFEVLCGGICDAIVLILFERMRGEEKMSQLWFDRQRRKVEGGLREMSRLRSDRPWAVGTGFSRADIAVGVTVAYADIRYTDLNWRSLYPNLESASQALEARPSFADTRPVPQVMNDPVV